MAFVALEVRRNDLIYEVGKAAIVAVPAAFFGFVISELVRGRATSERPKPIGKRPTKRNAPKNGHASKRNAPMNGHASKRNATNNGHATKRNATNNGRASKRNATNNGRARKGTRGTAEPPRIPPWFLDEVVVSYNRIKAVRRNLRAAGLGPWRREP